MVEQLPAMTTGRGAALWNNGGHRAHACVTPKPNMTQPASRLSFLRIVGIGLCAVLAGLLVALWTHKPATQPLKSGTLLASPRALPAFALRDQNGQTFDNAQLQGHWTLIFPGFTSCPDICPTTLAQLREVEKQLGDEASRLRIALLSVDPERDTPEKLKLYVSSFSPNFIGLTTPEPQLKELAKALGVAYVRVEGKSAGSYTMDHSAALILLDPQGRLAGFLTPPFEPAVIAADLKPLLASGA